MPHPDQPPKAKVSQAALAAGAALLLLASLAGCGKPPVQASPNAAQTERPAAQADKPPGQAGQPAQPPVADNKSGTTNPTPNPDPCPRAATGNTAGLSIWGDFDRRLIAGPGDCRFAAGTGRITLIANDVTAPTEAAAVQALEVTGSRLEGPVTVTRRGPDQTWDIYASLPAGPKGQIITLKLTPAPGGSPLTATLVRQAPPTVAMTVQGADGAWVPVEPGACLPPGPKRVRLQTRGIAAADLTVITSTSNWQKITPDQVSRPADDLIELVFDNPPPLVQMVLAGMSRPDGLSVPEPSRHFYIGEPPLLMAINPATGQATRIGPAPVETDAAVIRSDGRYAGLRTLPQTLMLGTQYWLVDLTTGTLTPTPFVSETWGFPAFDARGRLIAPLGRGQIGVLDPATGKADLQQSAATEWDRVSPDGRYIAGRAGAERGGSTGAWVGPPRTTAIVIRDLMTDTEQIVPWEGYSTGPIWLADGRLAAPTRRSNREPGLGPAEEIEDQWYTIDLRTGDRTPYGGQRPAPGAPRPDGSYQPASPDDRFLAMLPDGRALVIRWPNWKNERVSAGP
jgi:hypothetical protein